MAATNHKRKKKLIAPAFQLKVAASGMVIAIVSVMTLMVVFNQSLVQMIDKGWIDAATARNGWIGFLLSKLLVALAILVPLTLALCVVLSHRIAGPMYRFRVFLADVRDGTQTGPCRIRDGDEYHEFCELLNEVTAPLRRANEDNDLVTDLALDEEPVDDAEAAPVDVADPPLPTENAA